jgi:hypothetical protein
MKNKMYQYHWIWYLLGFTFAPRLTIMIALTLYAKELNIPLVLMIVMWILAGVSITINRKK